MLTKAYEKYKGMKTGYQILATGIIMVRPVRLVRLENVSCIKIH